jgi:hypothetical protein
MDPLLLFSGSESKWAAGRHRGSLWSRVADPYSVNTDLDISVPKILEVQNAT